MQHRLVKYHAYLLLFWSCLRNIIHPYRHELCYVVDTGSIRAILSRSVYSLTLSLGLFKPFSCYRVYDVENT